MIELASLFLGFVLGVRPVEVVVDARVAAVVLRLDDREVTRLEGPPWSAEVDFGSTLEPHRLEAVALDAAGRRLGRVSRLVNYARADYEAVLVLDPEAGAGGRGGRVLWAAVLDQDPVRLELVFDGERLGVREDGSFVLPPYDPETSHFLSADLTFRDAHGARAELAFGGRYGDRVTSALTAVAVSSPHGRPWSTADVRGWLERDGRTVDVFAASAEDGVVLLVMDAGLGRDLQRLLRGRGDEAPVADPTGRAPSFEVTSVSPRPLKAHGNTFQLLRMGTVEGRLGLREILLRGRPDFGREKKKRRQQLWDGVALAGRHASASKRPRAVVLMAGKAPEDRSVLALPQAADYLANVGVPFFVWGPDRQSLAGLGLADSVRAWSGAAGFEEVLTAVAVALASQTVVWLEGEHLPAEITLSRAAPEGVELVR